MTDFPASGFAAIGGAQPKLALVEVDGRFFSPGQSADETAKQRACCEDLATQLALHCQQKLSSDLRVAQEEALRLTYRGLLATSLCSRRQARWIMERVARRLQWQPLGDGCYVGEGDFLGPIPTDVLFSIEFVGPNQPPPLSRVQELRRRPTILAFTRKQPDVRWSLALLEWLLVAGASVALVATLGPAVLPPLHLPGGGWLVGTAVAVTIGRAILFGFWTNQVRAELMRVRELYRSLNAALEDQVARRTRELELRNAALEQANARLHDIASAVAHDLRQPIISISGQASVLRARLHTSDAGSAQVERILGAAASMDRICDGLLQLIQLETAELHPRTLDVSAMATLVCKELEVRYPEHLVRWAVQPGMTMRADSRLLRALLEIVLENAWTYTAGCGEPAVNVTGQRGVMQVADNGRGFEPASAERLFEPFRRVHADRSYTGLGINLALARTVTMPRK